MKPAPVYAVVGFPVGHSLSPRMHTAWLRHEGLPGSYVALEVPRDTPGERLVDAIRTLGLAGVNLTIPFKERVLDHLDEVAPLARRTGAVNTVVRRGDDLVGLNTDVAGFVGSLLALDPDRSAPPVVIGAGGAARAVVVGLIDAGFPPGHVCNRTPARAEALLASLDAVGWTAGSLDAVPPARVYVHALSREAPMVALDGVAPGSVWLDLNYDSASTAILPTLAARGITVADGREMLVRQGAAAFEAFTGRDTDPDVARGALFGGGPP